MPIIHERRSGALCAAVLDWAGTTVDHGSLAPVKVLTEMFAAHGVPITTAEARRDMGLLKKDHIRAITRMESVAARWRERHGSDPGETVVEALFAEFAPRQMECLAVYSTLIPGTLEAVAQMRAMGLKIGGTTGYTRPMLDVVMQHAGAQGYAPDVSLCPDDVGAGRPHPWMCYEIAVRLKVYPLWAMVKIGDTPSDIAEGRNAGMWTVGVTRTGNQAGLAESEWDALEPAEQAGVIEQAENDLRAAGTHYVAGSVLEALPALAEINARLEHGERP